MTSVYWASLVVGSDGGCDEVEDGGPGDDIDCCCATVDAEAAAADDAAGDAEASAAF